MFNEHLFTNMGIWIVDVLVTLTKYNTGQKLVDSPSILERLDSILDPRNSKTSSIESRVEDFEFRVENFEFRVKNFEFRD